MGNVRLRLLLGRYLCGVRCRLLPHPICGVEDEEQGTIVLLRGSGAHFDSSAHKKGAQLGLEPYRGQVGVRTKPTAVEAKAVQKGIRTRLLILCLFLRL